MDSIKNTDNTINELLGIEAMSQLLLEKSRKLRLKLAGDSSPAKKKRNDGGLTPEQIAKLRADRRKNMLRSFERQRAKEEAAKKKS
jgi:hypothetical protein